MSDERGPTWRRPRTNPDRDVRVEKHATPPAGVPAFAEEECTGRYEGDDLARIRARRPTPERIAKLEAKHDSLALTVSRMDGKLDTLVDLAAKSDAERERRSAADAVALERRRKHAIAVIGALGTAIAAVVGALVLR